MNFVAKMIVSRIVDRARAGGGACYVSGSLEVQAARLLVERGEASLRDDGPLGSTKRSNADGERWWFELVEVSK